MPTSSAAARLGVSHAASGGTWWRTAWRSSAVGGATYGVHTTVSCKPWCYRHSSHRLAALAVLTVASRSPSAWRVSMCLAYDTRVADFATSVQIATWQDLSSKCLRRYKCQGFRTHVTEHGCALLGNHGWMHHSVTICALWDVPPYTFNVRIRSISTVYAWQFIYSSVQY